MIISLRKRFLFIHVYKVAGTSIRENLEKYDVSQKMIGKSSVPWTGHLTASEVKRMIRPEVFNNLFKFAFVRNPWDWQVSLYNYTLKNEKHFQHELFKKFGDFKTYLKWRISEDLKHQSSFITDENGKILLDYIGKYESLEKDFAFACSQIGIKPNLKKLNVSSDRDYRKYYDSESWDLVKKSFNRDIKLFDYSDVTF